MTVFTANFLFILVPNLRLVRAKFQDICIKMNIDSYKYKNWLNFEYIFQKCVEDYI